MNYFIRKIQEGYVSWNHFRNSFHSKIILDRIQINNVDFTGCNLNGVVFVKCTLIGATFVNCDLTSANFKDCSLEYCQFSWSKPATNDKVDAATNLSFLREALLKACNLTSCDFSGCTISRSTFRGCLLSEADFSESIISFCDFYRSFCFKANFYSAEIIKTNFASADLTESTFTEAKLTSCDLSGARIYGISPWNIDIDDNTIQRNLYLNPKNEGDITVDNLEVGQFVYLLLNNRKIRTIIDTLTCKLVLILGRFTDERKIILNAIKDELRALNYVPILFDFDKPASRDFVETVSSLAHLSRFIIADFSDAKIVLEEVPHVARVVSVPIKPLLQIGNSMPTTLSDLKKFPWVLDVFNYTDLLDIVTNFKENVILPCESKLGLPLTE